MRGGKLLAERPPQQLMSAFNSSNLEEVFLTLSKKQEEADTDILSTHVRTSVSHTGFEVLIAVTMKPV
jgi:hypothetical protein